MIVRIPSPLRSYTNRLSEVDIPGSSISEVLANLDAKHPGIRFRMIDEQDNIRQHIKIFINSEQADSINKPLAPTDTLHIICALSGG